jgi:hypothetical protein
VHPAISSMSQSTLNNCFNECLRQETGLAASWTRPLKPLTFLSKMPDIPALGCQPFWASHFEICSLTVKYAV